jgi:hypothetical protein
MGRNLAYLVFVGHRKNKCAKLRIASTGLKNLQKEGEESKN